MRGGARSAFPSKGARADGQPPHPFCSLVKNNVNIVEKSWARMRAPQARAPYLDTLVITGGGASSAKPHRYTLSWLSFTVKKKYEQK